MKLSFSIPAEHKPFLLPLVVLLAVVLLSTTLMRGMITKLLEARTAIYETQQKNSVLTAKKQALSSLNQSELTSSVNAALAAVPGDDPVLLASSSIRDLALKENVEIVDLETFGGSGDKKNLKTAELSFELQGPLSRVLSFLRRLQKSAPLVQVSNIKMSNASGTAQLELSVLAFWSKLPDKLPSLDEPFSDITNVEREVLKQLSQMERKSSQAVTPLGPEGRKNPFVQ